MGHDIDQQQVRLDERRERVASRKHKTALLIQQSLSYTQDRQAAFTLLQEHGFRDAAQELVAHVVALQALSKAYLVPFLGENARPVHGTCCVVLSGPSAAEQAPTKPSSQSHLASTILGL